MTEDREEGEDEEDGHRLQGKDVTVVSTVAAVSQRVRQYSSVLPWEPG